MSAYRLFCILAKWDAPKHGVKGLNSSTSSIAHISIYTSIGVSADYLFTLRLVYITTDIKEIQIVI